MPATATLPSNADWPNDFIPFFDGDKTTEVSLYQYKEDRNVPDADNPRRWGVHVTAEGHYDRLLSAVLAEHLQKSIESERLRFKHQHNVAIEEDYKVITDPHPMVPKEGNDGVPVNPDIMRARNKSIFFVEQPSMDKMTPEEALNAEEGIYNFVKEGIGEIHTDLDNPQHPLLAELKSGRELLDVLERDEELADRIGRAGAEEAEERIKTHGYFVTKISQQGDGGKVSNPGGGLNDLTKATNLAMRQAGQEITSKPNLDSAALQTIFETALEWADHRLELNTEQKSALVAAIRQESRAKMGALKELLAGYNAVIGSAINTRLNREFDRLREDAEYDEDDVKAWVKNAFTQELKAMEIPVDQRTIALSLESALRECAPDSSAKDIEALAKGVATLLSEQYFGKDAANLKARVGEYVGDLTAERMFPPEHGVE